MQANGFRGFNPYQNGGVNSPFGQYGQYGQDPLSDMVVQLQMQMIMQLFMQQAFQMLAQALFNGAQGGMPGMDSGCGCGRNGGGYPGIGGGYPGIGGPQGNYPMMPGGSSGAGLGALQAAQSQVGVREATGNNDGLPAQRYSNGRREPWCANFVAWTFRQAGTPLPGNQRSLASVQYMEDQMKRTGQFHRGTPQPGDIIFFGNRGGSDRGGGRHVGIVERVENGKVYTIEGNSSNAVRRRSYDLNNPRISGYGRVGGGNNNVAGTGAPTDTGSLRGNNNAQRAYNYFLDKGLTPAQAAGIVGNLQAESGVRPGQHQIGGPAFGIAQWEGSRRRNLEQFARAQGKPVDDLGVQLDFIWHECQTTERSAFNALRQTRSAAEAAQVWCSRWERAGIPHMENRIAYANEALGTFA